jgi:hypothetical protein
MNFKMITLTNTPVYFNCFYFDKKNQKSVLKYKIESTQNSQYPFQLFKQGADDQMSWENLSIYSSIRDSVGVLLKELFSDELSEEVDHGQASIDPGEVLEKIDQGARSISIYGSAGNKTFMLERDISFNNLVHRISPA